MCRDHAAIPQRICSVLSVELRDSGGENCSDADTGDSGNNVHGE
jgi:hypothetical protein